MTKYSIFFLLLSGWAIAQELPVVGYSQQGEQIVFTFNTDAHQYAIQEDDGNVVPLSEITVHTVALTGEFTNWQTNTYPMAEGKAQTYQLRLPVDSLKGIDTQFAFVINANQELINIKKAAAASFQTHGRINQL